MKKSKLKKKLVKAAEELARTQTRAAEYAAAWDEYDDFQKWLWAHAPATCRRYEEAVGGLPRYRPQTMDEMLKYYYAPALWEQLNGSRTFMDAIEQSA